MFILGLTGPMAKKMGRLLVQENERRTEVITLRITADEKKAMGEAAARAGKKRSEWARNLLTQAASALQ